MKEITVTELKSRLDSGEDIQVIDVRESNEYEYCNMGGQLIPMGDIMANLDKISRDKPVVLHCKTGGRSGSMVQALMMRGFDNVISLQGGVIAWAEQIDTSLPTY